MLSLAWRNIIISRPYAALNLDRRAPPHSEYAFDTCCCVYHYSRTYASSLFDSVIYWPKVKHKLTMSNEDGLELFSKQFLQDSQTMISQSYVYLRAAI